MWVYTDKLTWDLNRYRPDQTRLDRTRPDRTRHTLNIYSLDKPIGASPRCYYEDGINMNRIGVGNDTLKRGGSTPWATD